MFIVYFGGDFLTLCFEFFVRDGISNYTPAGDLDSLGRVVLSSAKIKFQNLVRKVRSLCFVALYKNLVLSNELIKVKLPP